VLPQVKVNAPVQADCATRVQAPVVLEQQRPGHGSDEQTAGLGKYVLGLVQVWAVAPAVQAHDAKLQQMPVGTHGLTVQVAAQMNDVTEDGGHVTGFAGVQAPVALSQQTPGQGAAAHV
jgi:hypothetical protein